MKPTETEEDKRFMVFNVTDRVFVAPDFMTLQEAQELAYRFPQRYAAQGYYLTASGERVPAEWIELQIIDMVSEPQGRYDPRLRRWLE